MVTAKCFGLSLFGRPLLFRFIHRKGVFHFDLKCENVLVDLKSLLRICDFGSASYGVAKLPTTSGKILRMTFPYFPPECFPYLEEELHQHAVKVWKVFQPNAAKLLSINKQFEKNPGDRLFREFRDVLGRLLSHADYYERALMDILDQLENEAHGPKDLAGLALQDWQKIAQSGEDSLLAGPMKKWCELKNFEERHKKLLDEYEGVRADLCGLDT